MTAPEPLSQEDAVTIPGLKTDLDQKGYSLLRHVLTYPKAQELEHLIIPYTLDPHFWANKHRGTIWYNTVYDGFREECLYQTGLNKLFDQAFDAEWVLVDDKQQTIILTAGPGLRGTIWHQEAATIPEGALVLWVNLTPGAGLFSPTLSLVDQRFTEIVPTFYNDYQEEADDKDKAMPSTGWSTVSPHFDAGDGVLFDRYCIHRTMATRFQTQTRISLKFTAVKK